MSVRDLISAALNKDARAFEETFSTVMQEKLADAIGERFSVSEMTNPKTPDDDEDYEDYEDDEDDDEDDEEIDESSQDAIPDNMSQAEFIKYYNAAAKGKSINEISQDKIHQYYDAAAQDRAKAKSIVQKNIDTKHPTVAGYKIAGDAYTRFQKRGAGMTAAADRMNEEEIDEISNKTLGSYIKKASINAADHAYKLGHKKAENDEISRFTNRLMPNQSGERDRLKKHFGVDSNSTNATRRNLSKRINGVNTAVNKMATQSPNTK